MNNYAKKPEIGEGTFKDPHATVIGNVKVGKGCYFAPGAVARGDEEEITIGDYTNVQDCAVLHSKYV